MLLTKPHSVYVVCVCSLHRTSERSKVNDGKLRGEIVNVLHFWQEETRVFHSDDVNYIVHRWRHFSQDIVSVITDATQLRSEMETTAENGETLHLKLNEIRLSISNTSKMLQSIKETYLRKAESKEDSKVESGIPDWNLSDVHSTAKMLLNSLSEILVAASVISQEDIKKR